jgi:hypothetical protein
MGRTTSTRVAGTATKVTIDDGDAPPAVAAKTHGASRCDGDCCV